MVKHVVSLEDKFDLSEHRQILTGTQAVVRLLLMQKERDRQAERAQELRREGKLDEAIAAAERADVVVMCLGLSAKIEGEEGEARPQRRAGRRHMDYTAHPAFVR